MAFVVTVRHGAEANYLHGGFDAAFAAELPSDRLLLNAITGAQTEGLQIFNMMASPPDQPSLVRFKEKWGGITKAQSSYSVPLRPVKGAALHTLEAVKRGISSLKIAGKRS